MKKTLSSLLILALFVYGVGPHPFIPSLRLLQDTEWSFAPFWELGTEKLLTLLLLVPIGLGFVGWASLLKEVFFTSMQNKVAQLLGFSIAVSFFSLYVFGLAINEILCGPLVFLFFIPALGRGWRKWGGFRFSQVRIWNEQRFKFFTVFISLWLVEYISPPIIWDAVLDHFRYAGEISRLHQIPLYWTNHTGDMPKAAELILAGFWSLGGESLSKFSSVLAVIGIILLLNEFVREWKGGVTVFHWIFWTCPFFLAIFCWGYVEGFLATYETLALYCLWKALTEPRKTIWLFLVAFFLGFAFSIKYTALLAIIAVLVAWIYWKFIQKINLKFNWGVLILLLIPLFPWLLKNWLAFENPFYPLATSLFGTSVGYGPGMESALWKDTGSLQGLDLLGRFGTFWKVFFTPENAVAACWTPLVFMSLPWGWKAVKRRLGIFLLFCAAVFFAGWAFFCTSLRHASGGAVVLVLLAAMAWEEAFKEKKQGAQAVFAVGVLLSFWLCISAQLTTTAPYAAALGLEDPMLRLKRHYSYDADTYSAYRFIENHSDPKDKVMAFAVFQTYSLQRTAYVDFKWKRPIFLEWASECQTAERLARKLQEAGVRYFLYQRWEATAMSRLEKDFNLEGMPPQEYVRFWQRFMVPVESGENTTVYELKTVPLEKPRKLGQLPGLQEMGS